jgi:hypothetical protein
MKKRRMSRRVAAAKAADEQLLEFVNLQYAYLTTQETPPEFSVYMDALTRDGIRDTRNGGSDV